MGFENRRSIRIKTKRQLCYWPDGQASGAERWGHVHNLSETGLALGCALPLRFLALEGADRRALRRYVFEVADPKLAAQTGWGHAYFKGGAGRESKYRALTDVEQRQSLQDRFFLPVKEMVFLRGFQAHLETLLGRKDPQDFRLLGSPAP